ncbi:hypothetical protein ES703_89097 [subsurface metagenome]
MEKKKKEEYGKVKKEYDDFRKLRRELGLRENNFINFKQMKENLKESKLLKV